jgi:hypothetical protein
VLRAVRDFIVGFHVLHFVTEAQTHIERHVVDRFGLRRVPRARRFLGERLAPGVR